MVTRHPTHRTRGLGPQVNPRTAVEDVVAAAIEGDLVRAQAIVDEAGGFSVFGEDEALVEALCQGRGHAIARDDARVIVGRIAHDARAEGQDLTAAPVASPVGVARGLLARLVSALGLPIRSRNASDPVLMSAGAAPAPVAPLPASAPDLRPASDYGTAHSSGATPTGHLASTRPMAGARAVMRDIFARESWRPRVEVLHVEIAPHTVPGVWALQRAPDGTSRSADRVGGTGAPGRPGGRAAPPNVRGRLGAGRRLEARARARAQAALDEAGLVLPWDDVRVHDDANAQAICRELAAEAFALGADIALAGALDPEREDGLRLLVHELVHVGQQRAGRVGPGLDPSPALESEATSVAERASRGDGPGGGFGNSVSPEGALLPREDSHVVPRATAPTGDTIQRCAPRASAVATGAARPEAATSRAAGDGPVVDVDARGSDGRIAETTDASASIALDFEGFVIRLTPPELGVAGELEVAFEPAISPIEGLRVMHAAVRYDVDHKVLAGELQCEWDLEGVAPGGRVTFQVEDGGRVRADLEAMHLTFAEGLDAAISLHVDDQGVWGAGTVTAHEVDLGPMIALREGLVHARLGPTGDVGLHGTVTADIAGVGEVTIEAAWLDGAWGGRVASSFATPVALPDGRSLRDVDVEGAFAPDGWSATGTATLVEADGSTAETGVRCDWDAGIPTWSLTAIPTRARRASLEALERSEPVTAADVSALLETLDIAVEADAQEDVEEAHDDDTEAAEEAELEAWLIQEALEGAG